VGNLASLVFGHQQLGGLQPLEFGFERRFAICLEHREAPGGEIEPRESEHHAFFPAAPRNRGQQRFPPLFEQRVIGHRTGRDDAYDLPLDRALGLRRVADLFADGHRLALAHQAG
jgi:hypothetical protein